MLKRPQTVLCKDDYRSERLQAGSSPFHKSSLKPIDVFEFTEFDPISKAPVVGSIKADRRNINPVPGLRHPVKLKVKLKPNSKRNHISYIRY